MDRAIIFGRWALFIPVSCLTAVAANFVAVWVNHISMTMSGIDPTDFRSKVMTFGMAGVAMGASFVFVGTKLAPAHKRESALGLAGLALLVAGFLSFPAMAQSEYWALWQAACIAVGAGGVALEGVRE